LPRRARRIACALSIGPDNGGEETLSVTGLGFAVAGESEPSEPLPRFVEQEQRNVAERSNEMDRIVFMVKHAWGKERSQIAVGAQDGRCKHLSISQPGHNDATKGGETRDGNRTGIRPQNPYQRRESGGRATNRAGDVYTLAPRCGRFVLLGTEVRRNPLVGSSHRHRPEDVYPLILRVDLCLLANNTLGRVGAFRQNDLFAWAGARVLAGLVIRTWATTILCDRERGGTCHQLLCGAIEIATRPREE